LQLELGLSLQANAYSVDKTINLNEHFQNIIFWTVLKQRTSKPFKMAHCDTKNQRKKQDDFL